jgi:glyoxylase-like metal-dependent hydrolase (beta-lactamase superfamily II)
MAHSHPILPTSDGGVRIQRVVTSGVFELDGGSWEVDNNVWIVGDDRECLVIDCAHEAHEIVAAIDGRRVVALLCTHGHNDHVNASDAVKEATGGRTWLHPADREVWDLSQASAPDHELTDGQVFRVGDVALEVMHTPGHAPGAVCVSAPSLGVLFSGDTLFNGGPGATGRSFSDFPTIIDSIRDRLLTLPEDTIVLTGHGDATSIGAEKPHLDEWIARGH